MRISIGSPSENAEMLAVVEAFATKTSAQQATSSVSAAPVTGNRVQRRSAQICGPPAPGRLNFER